MKSLIKQCMYFLKKSVEFIMFLLTMLIRTNLKNPIVKRYSGTLTLLANGPSLKEVLPQLLTEKFKDTDFIVLNYFATSDIFTQIKPQHYCLADPMFFYPNHREQEVRNLYSILNRDVDWEMNLYIPQSQQKAFYGFANLKNPQIKVVPLNCVDYKGFECLRHYFYAWGLAMPPVNTVANMAIFIGINSGYKQINLYGVDHTFFDSLCINEKNELCNRDKHYYDNGEATLKPIIRNDNSCVWKISDYIFAIGNMFKSHDLLAAYAHLKDVRIVNCTKISMIDSYEREKIV